jgi:hypothetical protein
MSGTYKQVVFQTENGIDPLVWCEYRYRFQTLVEFRYQVRVYVAEHVSMNEYKKGTSLVDSSWKKTPQKARQDIEDEVGQLKKENILYEENISVSVTLIDEEF